MNILYLNHNVVWRSTFHRCFLFARELVLLGHHVTIVTNSPRSRLFFKSYTYEGVVIVEAPDLLWGSLRTGWDLVNVFRRCLYLRHLDFDLIHAFDTRPTVILPTLFYKFLVKKVPLVIDWADWWGRGGAITLRPQKLLNELFTPIETWFEEYFRKFADRTTVISQLLYQRTAMLGIPKKTIRILRNGVDNRSIKFMSKNQVRKKLGIPNSHKILFYPANVLYDLRHVIDIYKKIDQQRNDVFLYLAGEIPRQILQDNQDLIKAHKIKVLGVLTKEKLNLYLSASDLGLLPLSDNLANRARLPLKIGDFLAAGLPFVSNDVGETGELLKKLDLAIIAENTGTDFTRCIFNAFKYPLNHNNRYRIKTRTTRILSWKVLTKNILWPIYYQMVEHKF